MLRAFKEYSRLYPYCNLYTLKYMFKVDALAPKSEQNKLSVRFESSELLMTFQIFGLCISSELLMTFEILTEISFYTDIFLSCSY